MTALRLLVLSLTAILAAPLQASTYSVGSGACTHGTLAAALTTAVGDATPGPHLIKVQTGERIVSNQAINNPSQDLIIQGGYAQCADAAPTTGQRSTLRNNVASGARVLNMSNSVSTARRTVYLRNLTVTGGRNPGGINGGGIFAGGKLTLRLQNDTIVEDNIDDNGGGIGMVTLTADPLEFTLLYLEGNSSVENNQATALGANGYGGGIDCLGGCRVVLWNGSVSFNRARLAGGAIALRTNLAELDIDPFVSSGELVMISNNDAGQATFSSTEGYGGAIYSDQGSVAAGVFGSATGYGLWLFNNTANYGGAIYGIGPTTGARAPIAVMNAFVFNNTARSRGGAIYSRNGVDWTFDHETVGDCAVIGSRQPCSHFSGNQAETTEGGVGGGVAFLGADSGSQGGIAAFNRTLFANNADVAGPSAIAEATGGSRLNFRRSVFRNNSAGGPATQRTLFGSTDSDMDFFYNTVLDNTVVGIFYMNGGVLRPQGSIWWDPGATISFETGGATMSVSTVCLVSHTTAGLSFPPGSVWVADPKLNARYAPRGNSSALDHCSTAVAPGADLYGRSTFIDAPGVSNRLGLADLGAVEQDDILFANSFGDRPGN